MESSTVDLLVVGAGPTGIAIGAEARKEGLSVLLVDRGSLTESILNFPTFMTFFTTRDLLEIAGIPMSIPDEKPSRQQALTYYRAVTAHYQIPLALHEDVVSIQKESDAFSVTTRKGGDTQVRKARAVALATGYFDQPFKLDVPGAEQSWVKSYYTDPYRHFSEDVVIVGGGNTACEVALELYRNHARSVTLIVRDQALKTGVKYWVRPDVENRIKEGSIKAYFNSTVTEFSEASRGVRFCSDEAGQKGNERFIAADAAYVFIGFHPDSDLQRKSGIEVDGKTLVPHFDSDSCESNVDGLYIAGTLQAGLDTGRIFIENSRAHGPKIICHLKAKWAAGG